MASILKPNEDIAKGFETAIVTTNGGLTHSGVVFSRDDEELVLVTAEDKLIKLRQREIDEISSGKSSMPSNLIDYLNAYDLRDLIEYLATLK